MRTQTEIQGDGGSLNERQHAQKAERAPEIQRRSLGLWLNNNLHVQGKAEIPRVKNSKERNITGELLTEQLPEFTQG